MKLNRMKILRDSSRNFDKLLDLLLLKRKKKIKSNSSSVKNIINDVKKNGDKALLKYEKRFNQIINSCGARYNFDILIESFLIFN